MSATTQAAWKRWDRACAAVDKMHDCSPETWVHRVETPGFAPTGGIGASRWTCPTCEGLFVEIFTKHLGGAQLKKAGER